jgi:hypothetical protein
MEGPARRPSPVFFYEHARSEEKEKEGSGMLVTNGRRVNIGKKR